MISRSRPPVIAGAFVAVDPATAKIPEEDRLRLVRELSRLFGVAYPTGASESTFRPQQRIDPFAQEQVLMLLAPLRFFG